MQTSVTLIRLKPRKRNTHRMQNICHLFTKTAWYEATGISWTLTLGRVTLWNNGQSVVSQWWVSFQSKVRHIWDKPMSLSVSWMGARENHSHYWLIEVLLFLPYLRGSSGLFGWSRQAGQQRHSDQLLWSPKRHKNKTCLKEWLPGKQFGGQGQVKPITLHLLIYSHGLFHICYLLTLKHVKSKQLI